MKKDKQILIDYEEYLELEKCKKVLDDLRTEMDFNEKIAEDPIQNGLTSHITMPKSFRDYFSYRYNNLPILKLVIQAKEV